MAKRQSFLRTNIPFWLKNNPDATIPLYKLDYQAVSAERAQPVSQPPPAQVQPKDHTHIRETHTETMASFKPHPVQPRAHVPRWTKLCTNFKMPISSGQDTSVPYSSAFQCEGWDQEGLQRARGWEREGLQRARGWEQEGLQRARGGGSSLRTLGHFEKLPRSTHQDSYTAPLSCSVDKRKALGPDTSVLTLKGDGHPCTYETHYRSMFEAKPLTLVPSLEKHISTVSLGDKTKIFETQTTHSASFTQPEVYSSPVPKQSPHFHLGHTTSQSWSCTSREAFRRHTAEPVVIVKRNENQSSVPKGDMDPRRDQERMSYTTSSTSYPKMKPSKRPETDSGLITRSHVYFSPSHLQSCFYSTTNDEHYSGTGVATREKPASVTPSSILMGPDHGPNLTLMQTDYLPLPACKAAPSSPQHMTNISFPVAAELYSTTHSEEFTPKSTSAPAPASNQLSSHILLR